MPIHCPLTIARLSDVAFEAVDYRVMRHAFASQNELGRLCDESAYENDLKARLMAAGFQQVHTQVPLTVSHKTFSKIYRLDLVVEDALYELKTAQRLTGDHAAQLINYELLLGLGRGKLLNFRPARVEGQICATSLTPKERRNCKILSDRWRDITPVCAKLRETFSDLLADWGAFLDLALYQEALTHLLGGAQIVDQQVSLKRDTTDLGTQRFHLHISDTAFRVTAYTRDHAATEAHLQRLLALTSLRALQWINLNHARIELITLIR
jgi:GxxExxY protein